MNRVGEALQMKQHRQRLRGMKVEDKGLPGWHGLSTMGIMRSHEKKSRKVKQNYEYLIYHATELYFYSTGTGRYGCLVSSKPSYMTYVTSYVRL